MVTKIFGPKFDIYKYRYIYKYKNNYKIYAFSYITYVDVYKPTISKVHSEVDRAFLILQCMYNEATPFVFAVALHV